MTSTSTLAAASLMCNMFARSRHRRPKLHNDCAPNCGQAWPGLGYLTFWVIAICNRVPRQDDAHLWAASCCRCCCRRCCVLLPSSLSPSPSALPTLVGATKYFAPWHDLHEVPARRTFLLHFRGCKCSQPPPPPSPRMPPLLAGSALILCYAPRHGKGNSCARHDKG